MKFLLLILTMLILTSCSKSKTVLICGDHQCVNKAEAEQYFEENLSIEVKFLDKNKQKEINLVELNLVQNENEKKQVRILPKKETNEKLKILSNDEIDRIKKDVKNKKRSKKVVKKIDKQKKQSETIYNKEKNNNKSKIKLSKKDDIKNIVNKKRKEVVDVCTILEKCSIDEISKYLLKEGKKKDFPNISSKQ